MSGSSFTPRLAGAETPLIADYSPDRPISRDGSGCVVTQREFLLAVTALADLLPEGGQLINLCQGRYHFLLTFAAIVARGGVNILPPNRSTATIAQIRAEHPDALCISDGDETEPETIALLPLLRQIAITAPSADSLMPQVALSRVVAIAYTSGSTGKPKPNRKSWGILSGTAELLCKRLLPSGEPPLLVPTVPPQHMYGLETSILMVLQGGATLYTGDTFYPEEIASAFRTTGSGILITTPVHLLTLSRAGIAIEGFRKVICATAPLRQELACDVEAHFHTTIFEIYGFTEAGSVATRPTTTSSVWQLLDGMLIEKSAAHFLVSGPQFPAKVPVLDLIEPAAEGRAFTLAGRAEDMINVAGKRASLADLNFQLLQLPGICDGVMLMPEEGGDLARPIGIVVSQRNKREILADLSQRVDPVFLPRPLIFVEKIPRNETGKPQRQELLCIIERHEQHKS